MSRRDCEGLFPPVEQLQLADGRSTLTRMPTRLVVLHHHTFAASEMSEGWEHEPTMSQESY